MVLPMPPLAKPNLGMQAAKASWMAPVIAIGLNVLTTTMDGQSRMIIGFASFALYILGLCMGIAALWMMRKYGRRGILIPGIIGVVINGGLVLLFTVLLVVIASSKR
jgi:hypothetical protein